MNDPLFEADREPDFPPLISPQRVAGTIDPFAKARGLAALGCDSGTLVHAIAPERLRAAIVFAPEVALSQAVQVFCACATGFQNAFGGLAPPEVALHLTWDGKILVNGAKAGFLRMASSHSDPNDVPDWLVVGFDIWLLPQGDGDPGDTPDQTSLYMEGCAGVSPLELLEGWARHTLVWVNGLVDGDTQSLHREWRELLYGVGESLPMGVAGQELCGTFMGADANFAMLRRDGDVTSLIPLTDLLEEEA
ncbi:MAG: DUF4444 domain-containing protein [Rhodobacteraceae bacterium]|nr:DUF4444 domain-containing protein [Paracoccaceae bacterium]